jgi:metal-responsive CopG/Arc/MetJ family transcriptional regulator
MRTHVVLPEELLEKVDTRIGKRRRSRFIQEAIEEKLAREDQGAAIRGLAGLLKPDEVPEYWNSSEKVSEWVHNLRHHPDEINAPIKARS